MLNQKPGREKTFDSLFVNFTKTAQLLKRIFFNSVLLIQKTLNWKCKKKKKCNISLIRAKKSKIV